MLKTDTIQITTELLSLIARIDEFKGAWRALGTLAPDRLSVPQKGLGHTARYFELAVLKSGFRMLVHVRWVFVGLSQCDKIRAMTEGGSLNESR